jgi:MFS superfamily sulfate permease-like transporter
MAGLLDRQIAQLQANSASTREALRRMKFVEESGADGSFRFRQVESAKERHGVSGRIWRLKVGNSALDLHALNLVGGGAIVGKIPSGLPRFSIPKLDLPTLASLLTGALIIAVLGFMEAISIAKAMAARTGQRLDPNQELIGQGLGNVVAAFGQGYAVSGSFSRSAVNLQAGAVTGLSSVFTSVMVLVVLLFFTPLLYYLPQSVLAAVIMMAVVGLINFPAVAHTWRVKRSDGVISVITFVTTLTFAPHLDRGILIGVLLSVGVFLYRKMRPVISELSLWHDGHLRSAPRLRLQQCSRIAVIRFEGPLFFANTSYLEDEILARMRSLPNLKCFVLVASGINEIDASGEEALSLLVERLRAGGYDLFFAGLTEAVVDVLVRSHLYAKIGDDHIFPTAAAAIEAVWEEAHRGSGEKACPLRQVVPLHA